MRITNNMMINNMMRNLNRNMLRLDKRQMQASTGKRIHKPSDDPIAIARSLKVRTDISQLRQYDKNVDDAISWLETTELAAKNANEAVHRLRELMVQASNGPLTTEETTKIQEEVKEIKAQLISLGNTSYGSSYIFSGKKTNQALLDAHGNYLVNQIDYKNPIYIDDRQNIQVGNYENIGVNTIGFELFESHERSVVYSGDLGALPLANGASTDIVLELEEGKPITLTVTGGGALGDINIIDNYNAEIVIDFNGDIDAQINDIVGAFKEMAKEYSSPLRGYDFSEFEANELNGNNVENVLKIKATPMDAVAVDIREVSAVWETGIITPPTEDTTFTFMGVTLNIFQGTNNEIVDVGSRGATIVVDDYANLTPQMLVDAFQAVAQEDGSKIAGFTFQESGSGGLQVIAPEKTGNRYNKEVFGGTLDITNQDITTQLVIPGEAEKRTVAAGQKAGLIQLIDNLEKELLKGNTEEISNQLGMIDRYHQNLLRIKSEIGAKVNRVDLIKERVADDTINFRNLLSQLEDADMGEVLMELINEENVYRAALSIGARIIQPTLLDFLR